MTQQDAIVVEHQPIQGGYQLLVMRAPAVAAQVRPGQFVHVRVPHLGESVLRRPFSVFKADGEQLAILYKSVGKGTRTLQYLKPGETLNLVGPLGHGFPAPQPATYPVIVAGGYGMAALYLTARQSPVKGLAFFGGRKALDILCVKEFEALGWTVRVTTEDGSLGRRGLVTEAVDGRGRRTGSRVLRLRTHRHAARGFRARGPPRLDGLDLCRHQHGVRRGGLSDLRGQGAGRRGLEVGALLPRGAGVRGPGPGVGMRTRCRVSGVGCRGEA